MKPNDLMTPHDYCQRMDSRQECQEESKMQNDVNSKYGSYRSVKARITQHQEKFTKQEAEKLAKAYRSGKTVYELAEIFNCNRETVSNHLKASGVKMRRQSPTDAQVRQMTKLYKAGHSCAAVGKSLNLDPSVIWRTLKRNGVELRDKHERTETYI